MIPLRDINPRYSFPAVTVSLVAANLLVFIHELTLGPLELRALFFTYGMIPARLEAFFSHPAVSLPDVAVPLVTNIFLHGGWLHLIGNMWFLWVFGDNIEDRMGHGRFLGFYIVCGVGAALAHSVAEWGSRIPAVGASGAVAGVLGAYYVLFPHSRVVTLVPLVVMWFTVRLPAVFVLGYWMAIQVISGITSLGHGGGQGVAWWAHIGGFLLGALLARGLRKY